VEFEFTIQTKRMESIDNAKTSRNTTTLSTATTCLAMAVLFWVSQMVGGGTSPKAATAAPTDNARLLHSAVSATLLRREKEANGNYFMYKMYCCV
jgi:hypothetical protein